LQARLPDTRTSNLVVTTHYRYLDVPASVLHDIIFSTVCNRSMAHSHHFFLVHRAVRYILLAFLSLGRSPPPIQSTSLLPWYAEEHLLDSVFSSPLSSQSSWFMQFSHSASAYPLLYTRVVDFSTAQLLLLRSRCSYASNAFVI
jgi:hypothetical protein